MKQKFRTIFLLPRLCMAPYLLYAQSVAADSNKVLKIKGYIGSEWMGLSR